MNDSLALTLPPMRRKILRSFLIMVMLYGIVGVLMMAAVFLASGITPKALHSNYDSIWAASQMNDALVALRHPDEYKRIPSVRWAEQFERSLSFEEGNITESGEKELASKLRKEWNSVREDLESIAVPKFLPKFQALRADLATLVSLNQSAMFTLAEQSTSLRYRVFVCTVLLFLLSLMFAVYLSDGLANRLSSPLKAIAEALRNKPIPGEKLRLPPPTSLEMRILTHEMNQLWKRLSELRKLNVEEIATQRSKLAIVLEAVEDGILVIDDSNTVIQCNQGLLNILGLEQSLVVGHRWNDLPTSDNDYLVLREHLSPEMPPDQAIELDVDSTRRTFSVRTRKILNKGGETVATLYLLHDITERKQRERLKTEFIGVLSHELKTPLQSLGTAAELLLKRKSSMGEEMQMLVDTIHEDVSRIRAVAQDFVQVGLVDSRYLRLKVGRHALSELIQEWIKPFRIVAKDKGVTLNFQNEGEAVMWANIDVVKFPWAISNLLSNAIRFSPTDTTVTIYVSQARVITIEIRDEGPGIPAAVRMKMFDPYYQAPTGEASPTGFLGLGLTIAKEVVEAHQGKIEYLPGTPKGSTFRITLPVSGEGIDHEH
jgi:two-component system, NtrC family, sensor histidine kinase KinB